MEIWTGNDRFDRLGTIYSTNTAPTFTTKTEIADPVTLARREANQEKASKLMQSIADELGEEGPYDDGSVIRVAQTDDNDTAYNCYVRTSGKWLKSGHGGFMDDEAMIDDLVRTIMKHQTVVFDVLASSVPTEGS